MKMKTTVQNLWDAAKAVLTGKYMGIQAFLKGSNIQPKLTPKGAGERTANKT